MSASSSTMTCDGTYSLYNRTVKYNEKRYSTRAEVDKALQHAQDEGFVEWNREHDFRTKDKVSSMDEKEKAGKDIDSSTLMFRELFPDQRARFDEEETDNLYAWYPKNSALRPATFDEQDAELLTSAWSEILMGRCLDDDEKKSTLQCLAAHFDNEMLSLMDADEQIRSLRLMERVDFDNDEILTKDDFSRRYVFMDYTDGPHRSTQPVSADTALVYFDILHDGTSTRALKERRQLYDELDSRGKDHGFEIRVEGSKIIV